LDKPSTRILAFDWLRGIATIVMVQTHALALLRPVLRAGPFFDRLQALDGLVAPSFVFTAGFSIALVQVRGAADGQRLARIRRTSRRIGEVLLVATLVNWMWFPIFREPHWILRIDILQCIGLSLLLALPLLALLAPYPRVIPWATLALALAAFGTAPLAEHIPDPLGHFLNISTGSVFPLLPWAGYVYLGASIGAVAASRSRRVLLAWLFALAALGWAVHLAGPFWGWLYPAHAFWVTDPTNHGNRWAIVCLLVIALLSIEKRAPAGFSKNAAVRFITVFGTSSMAAYFFHEALLYYRIFGLFSFARFWEDREGWWAYWGLTCLLIAATFALAWLTDRVYSVYDRLLRGKPAAPTSLPRP
jgi:uncharacterized membrane protein